MITRAGALLGLVALAGGCGGEAVVPDAIVGTYRVAVAADGKSDENVMTVVRGSGEGGLLISFIYGIDQVRANLSNSTEVKISRQKLSVSRSIGAAEGIAEGAGTISAEGEVWLSFDLLPPGVVEEEAPVTTYTITGERL